MLRLWIKTLGRVFFAQHAGFFLFVVYFIFGAVEPGQMLYYNLALLTAISSSLPVTAIFCILLLLYGLKSLAFIRSKLSLPAYNFINISAGTETRQQKKAWLLLYLFMFSPLLVYTILVIGAGLFHQSYLNIGFLLLWLAGLLIVLIRLTIRRINARFLPAKHLFKIKWPDIPRPFVTWKLFYLLQQQTVMFLACKILSLFLFKGIIWMFGKTDSDVKVYHIALLTVVLTHSVIVSTVWKFEKTQLSFVNCLPLNGWSRLMTQLIFYAMLFAPELLIYGFLTGLSPILWLTGVTFCIGSVFMLYFSLYLFSDNTERYLKFIFMFFIATLLIILYNQVLLFSITLVGICTCYQFYLYYRCRL